MHELLPIALGVFAAAAALSAGLTALGIRLCLRWGHVAPPDPWHDRPIALSVGTAVFAAFIVVAAIATPHDQFTIAVLGGAAAMFVVGLVDDLRPLRADRKLLYQVAIAAGVAAAGVKVGLIAWPVVAIPLTLFWFVGLTNAMNLIDNMDGLAPGVSAIAGLFLGILALLAGDVQVTVLAFVMAGACTGFLFFNIPPARAFLGDAGSLFIGFTLAAIGILSTWTEASSLFLTLAIPVIVLWIPIFNTTFVTLTRLLLRVPVSKGQADHINYRLVAHGLSSRRAVFLVYTLAIAGGLLALLYTRIDNSIAVAFAIVATVVVCVLGSFLFEGDITSLYEKYDIQSDSSWVDTVRRYRTVGMMLLDVGLISVAYFGAYLLRFEGAVPAHQMEIFIGTLPLFLVIRLVVFTGFSLYQRYWRYIGVVDLVHLGQAVAVSSLIQVLIVFGARVPNFSRSVLVLDALLALLLLAGLRLSTRVLRAWTAEVRARLPNEATLIIGAGDAGELALRELRNNPGRGMRAVGFIDDDVAKRGLRLHGLRVLGTTDELPQLVDRFGVFTVLIAIPSASRERLDQLAEVSAALGAECYEFWVTSSLRRVGTKAEQPRPHLVPVPDSAQEASGP